VFVAMNVFLILNGHEIETAEAEAVDVMLRLAAGSLNLDGLVRGIEAARTLLRATDLPRADGTE